MKNIAIGVLLLMFPIISFAQEEPEGLIEPDMIIGEYGISLEDQLIGSYYEFPCGPAAECYGYQRKDNISFQDSKLYFIDGVACFEEDLPFDRSTLKTIYSSSDIDHFKESKKPIYIDRYKAYSNIYGEVISELDGFSHYKGNFLIKESKLAYLDIYGFYILSNSEAIDKATFEPIAGQFFYDKNGVYYIENGYSEVGGRSFSDYEKIQDRKGNDPIDIIVDQDYYVINDIVYDVTGNLSVLELDPNKIQKLLLNKFDGQMLLFDSENVYERPYGTYAFDKSDCEDEYEQEQIYCQINNLQSLGPIRKTGFLEYHLDRESKTLYFDAYQELGFSKISGQLYHSEDGYFITDLDYVSTDLNHVKIWNTDLKEYEELDLSQYQYIHDVFYWYKGDLYGHHSEIESEDFSLENARVIRTKSNVYFLNKDTLLDVDYTFKETDLETLKPLRLENGELTDFVVGDGFLVYNRQVIPNINTQTIEALSAEILRTKESVVLEGLVYPIEEFPFEITRLQ